MRSLIWFELKKMVSRRMAIIVNVGVVAVLVGIMALNVLQTSTVDAEGNVLGGTEAIAYMKEERAAHAGVITNEQAASDIASYQSEVFAKIDPGELSEMTDAAAYSLVMETYGMERGAELYNPYWNKLLQPWKLNGEEPTQTAARVTPSMASDWYGAVADMTQDNLDDGQSGMWEYSDKEREYWTNMQASVETPYEYGWVGGWENIIDCFGFLVFAILAVCITLSPVFSFEYQSGADAVVLSTRYGRSRLIAAKIVASLVYATAVFAICTAVVVGFSLAFFGAEGFAAPIQNIGLASPYPLSSGQAALVAIALMYLVCIGFACLTLAISSRVASPLTVFVIDVVLVLVTGLIPSGGVAVLERILALFPVSFSTFGMMFASFESYPLGPIVVDLIGMIVIAYALLALICIPIATSSFRRHQVS